MFYTKSFEYLGYGTMKDNVSCTGKFTPVAAGGLSLNLLGAALLPFLSISFQVLIF